MARSEIEEKRREARLLFDASEAVEAVINSLLKEENVIKALCDPSLNPEWTDEPSLEDRHRMISPAEVERTEALFKQSLTGMFADVPPGKNGRAPDGFAGMVRDVAYRCLAAIDRPIDRNEVYEVLILTGLPLPKIAAKAKISKILAMDPKLINDRRMGYLLSIGFITHEPPPES